MRNLRFLCCCSVFLLIAFFVLACGSSNVFNSTLKSITVTPATAGEQAQFTATGTYANGRTVSPLSALWTEGNPWVSSLIFPPGITVDATGFASCNRAGTYTVEATAPADPHVPLSQLGPTTPQVSGMAQLSCT
jgi:hypothetical protein